MYLPSDLRHLLMRDTAHTGQVDYVDLWRRHLGGIIPTATLTTDIHAADGATYTMSIVWLRRRLNLAYHSPRTPRKVRRELDAEMARIRQLNQQRLAERTVRPGDVILPGAARIPNEVLSLADSHGHEWHRAFGEMRYAAAGFTGQRERREYDWIRKHDGVPCAWSTAESLLERAPLSVLVVI